MKAEDGLRMETASSIIARDTVKQFLHTFAHVIRHDRLAGQACTAAFIDGLVGCMALVIAGGHGGKDEVLRSTEQKLRDALDRDLLHLRKN